jgi:fido (protein-threonine AMPylation protein)
MLTLASVHPFLDGRGASAGELVDVVLEGALQHHTDAEPVLTTSSANPTSRGRSQCSSV